VETVNASQVEPPAGIYSSKVDEKGRLKLPADMWDYLKALGARRVFCTTIDLVTGKIYTTHAWNENKKVLSEAPPEKKKAGNQLLFMANAMGGNAEPDEVGRMIIPMEVREKLGIRDAKIYLENTAPGVITFYSEAIYEERKRQAMEDLSAKVEYFESIGLT
jgi:MraZ protein